jgi:hypothetical protein
VLLGAIPGGGVRVSGGSGDADAPDATELPADVAAHVFVSRE